MLDTFSSDQPISSSSEDLLGRASFASRLADTISRREDEFSISIGVYGAWGDGKTSVLRMMKEYLSKRDNIIVIDFNPWIFKSEESLLSSFFTNLAENIGKKITTKTENIGELLKKYGGIISIGGFNAEKLGESLSTTQLEELKNRVEKILCDNHKKVVILIDDIDRLDRDETYAIFKLVRLTASFKHTSYVLAFDHEIVSAALGERYAQGGKIAGEAFLEKIIQVPLHLPAADANKLRQITLQGVGSALNQAGISLTHREEQLFVYCFNSGIASKFNTPRLSRLYYNALLFSLPLLKGEVNPIDQMLLEAIRIIYPGLYRQIRKTPQLFLRGMPRQGSEQRTTNANDYKNFAEGLLTQCLPELSNREHQEILKNLFPNLFPALLGHSIPRDADANKRISSSNYFWKYFMYSVPSDDISDLQLEYFLETLVNDEGSNSNDWFNQACNKGHSRSLVRKFLDRLPNLDERHSYCLLRFIIGNLESIDTAYKPFLRGEGARSMTQRLLAELFKKVSNIQDQEELIIKFVKNSNPLGFVAIIFFFHIRFSGDNAEETRILSSEVEEKALLALAARISDLDKHTPLYFKEIDVPKSCYRIMGETLGYNIIADRLKSRFDSSPEDVDLFLISLAGHAWVVGSYEPQCGDFDNDNYVEVSKMIDTQYIMDNLVRRFGDELNDPIDPLKTISPKLKVARQFSRLHRAALSKNEEQSPTE